jgi:hypothetical protein
MLCCNSSLVTAMKLKFRHTLGNREAVMLLLLPYILQQCLNENRILLKALLPHNPPGPSTAYVRCRFQLRISHGNHGDVTTNGRILKAKPEMISRAMIRRFVNWFTDSKALGGGGGGVRPPAKIITN